jgi:internalin A
MSGLKYIALLFIIVSVQALNAQTVVLPDTNLRNKLISAYPDVMSGEELDTAAAKAMTGTLDLRFSSIQNATGVEYFLNIHTLDLGTNELTYLPDISALVNLDNLYLTNNKLDTIPDLDALSSLKEFHVMNNNLTHFPELIDENIVSIYCSNNQLTDFPDLTDFSNLVHLVIGENSLDFDKLDVSKCTQLVDLHIHKMGLKSVIGLEFLSNLTTLFAWENDIEDFSGLDELTTIQTLVIFNNPITELPRLDNKSSLNWLAIKDCQLTFEDIEVIFEGSLPGVFSYSSQSILQITGGTHRAENELSFTYPADDPSASNIYVWLKNGEVIDSSTSETLKFSPMQFSDSGSYQLKVYNTVVADLVLESNVFEVSVIPCLEFELLAVDILNSDCADGYEIDLSNASVSGGTDPLVYDFTNGLVNIESKEPVVSELPAGDYEVTLSDAKGCAVTQSFRLNRIEGCDPVFSPNGDGIADDYFIEDTGEVKVYDMGRNLVNILQGPTSWDGTDENGQLLDAGYYILLQNNQEPVHLTLVR